MEKSRTRRAKLNMLTTILRQVLATLCGIVIPKVMISTFGSVVYGATTSIAQFLSYVALFEGGIGRVVRGELYQHLAEGNKTQISKIHQATKAFFRGVGVFFVVYTVILALSYFDIADITVFDRRYTFGLVVAISLSTMANYFGGIGNMTLMHADQKQYLTNTVITVTNVINTVCIVLLVQMDADVLTVKLISSIVFIFRPLFYAAYVKKHYALPRVQKDPAVLSQKWTGMGQHVAYFLHTNTDIVMLTLLADLKLVAVYSVYHLVVSSIWNIASSFSGGMEAAFGDMIAKKEQSDLRQSYGKYKFIITLVALVLFGCTATLILPFIKIYLEDVSDADYIQPLFAMILICAEFLNCLALPCTTLPISANRLKQTRWGSYGEALINITVSLCLIQWNPLLGVAIGTLAATVFKCVYYLIYSARQIIRCSLWRVLGRFVATTVVMAAISLVGMGLMNNVPMKNFWSFGCWGVLTFLAVSLVSLIFCAAVFPEDMKNLFGKKRAK